MNLKYIIYIFLYSILIFFLECNDSPVEPYFPPIPGEEEEENNDDNNTIDPLENIYNNYEWIGKIISNHPRIFFNNKTFPVVKSRALNEESNLYQTLKAKVDAQIGQSIEFENPLVQNGDNTPDHRLGNKAAEAAFVYLIEEDSKYFKLARDLLSKVTEYYELRNRNQLNINWYSYSRIHALMAFDWLFNDLSTEDRKTMGQALFNEIEHMLPSTNRANYFRENRSGTDGGFYNNQSLEWYLGIAFYKSGINDKKAEEYMKMGFDSHNTVFKHRENAAGDDGGAASGTLAYSLADYPWAEYNFFQSFISATGGYNVTTIYDYLANWPNYLFWNTLPKIRQFGFGDERHEDNSINYPIINMHLTQFIHFYGDRFPQQAALAKWMMKEKFQRRINEPTSFSLARFFINNKHESVTPTDLSERMPVARYFERMGQVLMRSGSGENDTYASFTVSGKLTHHKHFDNNNFMIYRKGFQTIDSGTRPDGNHLSHYYPRTVAHNCITIRMPGEIMPHYWGSKAPHEANEPFPNDGGQARVIGTELVAFDEMEHYVYVASDATNSYNTAKTKQVLRQFVFLPPDNFVVFDRVNATNPAYPKKWLLHTAYKPEQVSNTEFYASHEDGRLVCKTILPEDAKTELIGGPGKQFWADGKNWPLPYGGDNHPLYGQWRVEVSPGRENNNDLFLHLIQVSDRTLDKKSIPSASKLEENGMKGVQFTNEGKEYKILFSITGAAGGKISIKENGKIIVDENFTTTIKHQLGLALK